MSKEHNNSEEAIKRKNEIFVKFQMLLNEIKRIQLYSAERCEIETSASLAKLILKYS